MGFKVVDIESKVESGGFTRPIHLGFEEHPFWTYQAGFRMGKRDAKRGEYRGTDLGFGDRHPFWSGYENAHAMIRHSNYLKMTHLAKFCP